MLQLVPKQKKKTELKKKFRLSLYSPFCDRTAIPTLSVPPLFFFFKLLSLLCYFFCCFLILFLFYFVNLYTGGLLWWLKIKLGVAAQLTRLQALGPRPKLSPLSIQELRRARCSTSYSLLSVHDIEFSPSFLPYFTQQCDRHQVWAPRISFPPFIPLHRDPQRSQRELEFLFSDFSSSSLIFLLSAECIASMTAKQPSHRTSFHCNNGSCRCLGV